MGVQAAGVAVLVVSEHLKGIVREALLHPHLAATPAPLRIVWIRDSAEAYAASTPSCAHSLSPHVSEQQWDQVRVHAPHDEA